MKQYRRGFVLMISLILVLLVGGTLLHNWGQSALEQEPVSLLESLEFVTQTMTTVGYGQGAGWSHPLMYVLAISLQLTGISVVFLSIPVVVTPWLESRFQTQPPKEYQGSGDHVLITNYSTSLDDLLKEIRRRDLSYVILEEDRDIARDLLQDNYSVVHGNARDPDVLERVRVTEASTVILEGTDQRNASVALVIRELYSKHGCKPVETLAIAHDTSRALQLEQAGVDRVVYPREVVGEALAEKILKGSSTSMNLEMLSDFEIREYPLPKSHPLVNQSLESTQLTSRFGVNPIGVWRIGQFHTPSGALRLESNDVLVVAGHRRSLDELDDFLESRSSWETGGANQDVMIVGYGQEGRAAHRVLEENGIEPTVVNDVDGPEVDVVGDAMDEQTLRRAGIEDVDVVIVTISLDDESVMVALLVERLNPQAEVLVQVRTSPTVESAYRSGASYVQSLDQVTSRMLVSRLLGETFLDFDLNMECVRTTVGDLVGKTPGELNLVHEHGVLTVGVLRDGESLDCEEEGFRFRAGDEIVLVGVGKSLDAVFDQYNLRRLQGETSDTPETRTVSRTSNE